MDAQEIDAQDAQEEEDMTQYTTKVSEAGDRVIARIKQAQDRAVSAVSQVSGAVGNLIPSLPKTRLTQRLPNPGEIVETAFVFAEQLLEAQKSYALDLLEALVPVTSKIIPSVKPRRAVKRAAAKAS